METARDTIFCCCLILLTAVLLIVSIATVVPASVAAPKPQLKPDSKQGEPAAPPGVYFYRLEPSFYTGFAPRCQDPKRIHIRLGRGNQLRVTVVLSDQILDQYIPDLAFRHQVYQKLVNSFRITLTQNVGYEEFKVRIKEENIPELAKKKGAMTEAEYRKLGLTKLHRLNPGRIFHIRIDFDRRIRQWSRQLDGLRGRNLSKKQKLDLINDMLPTRLTLTQLAPGIDKQLRDLIERYARHKEQAEGAAWDGVYSQVVDLFTAVSHGIYPLKGKMLDFYEFTAIYPVGTLNQFAKYDGQEIPLYPCPGKRTLKVHQRTRRADHIPDAACYGYLPWLPYMHVGKRLHNSFHTLWFNIDTRRNKFIPDEWRQNTAGSRSGKPYPHLWLVSRGPMSHGCTHVNAGHISELRQILPSKEANLLKVDTFRNKSNHFDVYDIDGDGRPEVMGIKYFYAYSLRGKKPYRMRAPTDRKAFYQWLYKNGYRFDNQGRLVFDKVITSAFYGRTPTQGKTYVDIPLYEANYTPETIQFYKPTSISFVRELRRVSISYDLNRRVLKLDQ
jgi:hypothetical protein